MLSEEGKTTLSRKTDSDNATHTHTHTRESSGRTDALLVQIERKGERERII